MYFIIAKTKHSHLPQYKSNESHHKKALHELSTRAACLNYDETNRKCQGIVALTITREERKVVLIEEEEEG
jgi:hypothetical protein